MKQTPEGNWIADIYISKAGAYDYLLSWTSSDGSLVEMGKMGHYVVDPRLTIEREEGTKQELPLDAICLQTHLTKLMGPLTEWEGHFKLMGDLGYNMIHLTPIQELGSSNSAYSLYDQITVYSKLFPDEPRITESEKFSRLKSFIDKMEKKYGVVALGDIVWNHTSHDTPWIGEHPEAAYNTDNCPYLKPAAVVDIALHKLAVDLVAGKYNSKYGLYDTIRNEDDIGKLCNILKEEVLPPLRLWEFFIINIDDAVNEMRASIKQSQKIEEPYYDVDLNDDNKITEKIFKEGIYYESHRDRFSIKVKLECALRLFNSTPCTDLTDGEIDRRCEKYQHMLEKLNLPMYMEVNDHIQSIVSNVASTVRYERLADHGPKKGPIKEGHLVDPYFRRVLTNKYPHKQRNIGRYSKHRLDIDKFNEEGVTYCAHNGWIWGGNPLFDFAGPDSKSYIRREVIIWGDCIKFRYGAGPSDSPWLWQHMKEYTQFMAKIFHGLRVDNAHSTPIHVARYLIDAAREVRPELYVTAELFTGSEEVDNIFISKLGINSLIREGMQAGDPWELGRLVHRYGGSAVGSVVERYTTKYYSKEGDQDGVNMALKPRIPPALFMDCTHDNEVPNQKRSLWDTLPNAALVTMARCAIGSVKGYDAIYPQRIDLVNETKLYPADGIEKPLQNDGVYFPRKILNELHKKLEVEGYTEIHVHQEENVITVQRHNPINHKAVYAICHTAFYGGGSNFGQTPKFTVKIPHKITKLLFAAQIDVEMSLRAESSDTLQGIASKCRMLIDGDDYSSVLTLRECNDGLAKSFEVHFNNFHPGAVVFFEATLHDDEAQASEVLSGLHNDHSLFEHFKHLDCLDFNYLLYRCEAEERSVDGNSGVYNIPEYGPLVFAGIQGFVSVLQTIRLSNDMGHQLFNNLRGGNWIMDYILYRVERQMRVNESEKNKWSGLYNWLKEYFEAAKKLPRYLIPKSFDRILMKLYLSAIEYVTRVLMVPSAMTTTRYSFFQQLLLTSVQLVASLPNNWVIQPKLLAEGEYKAAMAAGLPHFSTGYMRVWGRDTFISLNGLLIRPGRYKDARDLILGFGSSMRHGLIPNLLDQGYNPRYNCRDAVWWWLASIQDYCVHAPEGVEFLKTSLCRLFPWDDYDNPNAPATHKVTLMDLIQEAMQRHVAGIYFRERNASKRIDDKMTDEGFNVSVSFDYETGFVSGGNRMNCGTWMDKMGDSAKAGNFGLPATSRDGADVEIIGLLKYTVRWLSELAATNSAAFPHKGVKITVNHENKFLSYEEWNKKIQANFEKYFYVPLNPIDDVHHMVDKNIVNRRGIYKDVYGSNENWHDYQFRPNQCVAMALAPELFNPDHARTALHIIENNLLGPLGMKTLDPSDMRYRPNYDNGADTDDFLTSKGFNYHQGPEWLWPVGYFLKAKIQFAEAKDRSVLANHIWSILKPHRTAIDQSYWCGLPELTNYHGNFCRDSCPSQAWSTGTIIDAIFDLHALMKQK
jgi:glycogen debranching enzyme